MDFIKSRWSSTRGNNVQVNQSQPIDASYNTVTFTNAGTNPPNPIIISTQRSSQISIINEAQNTQLRVSAMTSPTDSFHSVVSTFHNDKKEGKVNMAFAGSNNEINNQQQHHQPTQSQRPQNL